MWWLVLSVLAVASGQETCLSVNQNPYFLFGTKTAYKFASKDIPTSRAYDLPGCQPTAFWLLNRHGSHHPEANEIGELQKLGDLKNNIITNYKNGNFRTTNQRICTSDLNLLEQWQWNYRQNATFAGDLTLDGYMTTQQHALAWKHRFPGLLTNQRHNYLFKFAKDQRSSNTYKAFTEGLFGAQAEGFDIPKENDENLLRPYKSCPAWVKAVGENNDTLTQRNIFESKMEYKEMISNISLRLGFNYDIQKETVLRIYQMCRYNKAWDVTKISPWCAAFTREDLKRLEFAEDLETFYRYGYGTPLNKHIGCAPVKDMMTFFDKYVGRDPPPNTPRAMIQFTEAEMLLFTLRAMGVTGVNYHSTVAQSRKWSTSIMSPFNANLAAVLYKCTQNGNFQVNEEYQILFLQNEYPLNLPDCKVGLCAWSVVKSRFQDLANKCDLKFCNNANTFSNNANTFSNNANTLSGFTAISFAAIAFVLQLVVTRI